MSEKKKRKHAGVLVWESVWMCECVRIGNMYMVIFSISKLSVLRRTNVISFVSSSRNTSYICCRFGEHTSEQMHHKCNFHAIWLNENKKFPKIFHFFSQHIPNFIPEFYFPHFHQIELQFTLFTSTAKSFEPILFLVWMLANVTKWKAFFE